ncbi:hypothetical protein CBM2585_B70023 [Cupriavidus taiwanensis]|nr:hypothetical protein CBM2585_B70023 [Cupriavidus taiwanensis]SPC17484.1 hypothetical protein CT19431_MP150011 [Cupriavidus taiwanensis]
MRWRAEPPRPANDSRTAAKTEIGDSYDSSNYGAELRYPSLPHSTSHHPDIGASTFDQGGALHAGHRR